VCCGAQRQQVSRKVAHYLILGVGWASSDSNRVTPEDGCIGRGNHCEGTSDPMEDDSWKENP
jgi:hypothetical protein